MSSITGHQPVNISNEGGRIGQQAGTINVLGDNIVHNARAQDAVGQLPYAADAPFNSFAKQHEPVCLPDTRVDLLDEIYTWADGPDERCIFWLSGLAGTGKSTIARTVARKYYDGQGLAASFFFSRGGGDVGHAGKFVTSIAVQLAHSVPAVRQHISEAVAERGGIASHSLHDQWQHLVCRPLSKLHDPRPYVMVVDALDECDNEYDVRIIVRLLAEVRSSLTGVQLRVLLTSRPEVPIRFGFGQVPHAEHKNVVLHDVSPPSIDHDIGLFLEDKLRTIQREHYLRAGWPGADKVMRLVLSASGLFIWAATACRFIQDGRRFADERLETILCSNHNITAAPEKHLDQIYVTVLKGSVSADYTEEEREKHCDMLRYVLGSIVVLFSPLSAWCLSALLHLKEESVEQTLNDLHTIISIPEDRTQLLRLHHPSFRDFLLSKARCIDAHFWIDEQLVHRELADNCIQVMSSYLKRDICKIGTPSARAIEVGKARVEQFLRPELRYACLYWIPHFAKSGTQLRDGDPIHAFLQKHYLHWLEALGWMGNMPEGIHALSSLESLVLARSCPQLYAFLCDMKRFAVYGGPIIEQAPLQVYYSTLMFPPSSSVVKNKFFYALPACIKHLPSVELRWDALLQTLAGHSDLISGAAFSPDGRLVASASHDKTVRLWDAGTGAERHRLMGHSRWINTVVFSPDSQVVASASSDTTVRLWDTGTGAEQRTLAGHLDWVIAAAFSPDGKVVASASYDKTVKLWNVATGAEQHTLIGHSSHVRAVVFSPDGKAVATASADTTVKLWDADTGRARCTFDEQLQRTDAVTMAPTSDYNTVKERHTANTAHLSYVSAVTFSPDGKVLASALYNNTIKLWDVSTGAEQQTRATHARCINIVVFSPDGKVVASASYDNTVKIWDVATGGERHTLAGHSDWVRAIVFSPDGKLIASASRDTMVKIWDVATGAMHRTYDLESYIKWIQSKRDPSYRSTNLAFCALHPPSRSNSPPKNV